MRDVQLWNGCSKTSHLKDCYSSCVPWAVVCWWALSYIRQTPRIPHHLLLIDLFQHLTVTSSIDSVFSKQTFEENWSFLSQKMAAMIFRADVKVFNFFIGEISKSHHLSQCSRENCFLVLHHVQEMPVLQLFNFVCNLQSAFLTPNMRSFR